MKTSSDYLENGKDILHIRSRVAVAIGLNESILVQQLNYWLNINKDAERTETHFFDGRWWAYNTYHQWQERNFPFWSVRTIQRNFAMAVKLGVVLTKPRFDDMGNQLGNWYTIDYDKLDELVKNANSANSEVPPMTSCLAPHDNLSSPPRQVDEPYTEITTETTHFLVSPAFDKIPMPAYFSSEIKVSDDETDNDSVGNELHPLELTIIEFCKDTGTKKLEPSHRKLLRSPVKFKYNGEWVEISPIKAWDDLSFFGQWIENELLISLGNIIPKDESGKRKISRTKVVQYIRSQMHTFEEWQDNTIVQNSSETELVCEICHGDGYYFDEEWNQVKCSCGA